MDSDWLSSSGEVAPCSMRSGEALGNCGGSSRGDRRPTRTSAPPGPSGRAELAKRPSGGISSSTLHRRAVHRSADDAASDLVTRHEPGEILAGALVATLYLQVEVVGCPTVCRHCWAQGVPYQAMPVDDVALVLEQAHRFCDDHGLGLGAYPMHEVAAHPRAAELLRLFADHVGAAEFEPLSTTGVPLAVREDWQQVLAAAAGLGTTTVWVAFHGLGVEHDRPIGSAS